MVGEECNTHPELMMLKYPVSQGVVQDWDDMISVWNHAFCNHLKIDPTECKLVAETDYSSQIMLTEPPLNPISNREKMLQTMFEVFGFKSAFVQIQAVLTLYAQGLLSGLVLDSGDGVTHVHSPGHQAPEHCGPGHNLSPARSAHKKWICIEPCNRLRAGIAAMLLPAVRLFLVFQASFVALDNPCLNLQVRKLKEELCYVACDYERELKLAKETTVVTKNYTLPDGHVIKEIGQFRLKQSFSCVRILLCCLEIVNDMTAALFIYGDLPRQMQCFASSSSHQHVCDLMVHVASGDQNRVGAERFMASEALFRPEMMGSEESGISQMVFDCIQEVDIDLRMAMYKAILLSGGTTMVPGLASRMHKDLSAMYLRDVLKSYFEVNNSLSCCVSEKARLSSKYPFWATVGDASRMKAFKLRVEDPPQRGHMVFLGAGVLADVMKDRSDFWVSKSEYEEDPRRALLKCGG
eukprot:scaffold114798_cov49-Prasinocladus_malaysianus.AAC.2